MGTREWAIGEEQRIKRQESGRKREEFKQLNSSTNQQFSSYVFSPTIVTGFRLSGSYPERHCVNQGYLFCIPGI